MMGVTGMTSNCRASGSLTTAMPNVSSLVIRHIFSTLRVTDHISRARESILSFDRVSTKSVDLIERNRTPWDLLWLMTASTERAARGWDSESSARYNFLVCFA
jgi:hypothetical protein